MTIGYRDDYEGEIVISRVGNDLKPLEGGNHKNIGWKYYYAWPKAIGDIPLDYTNGEAIAVDVTLAYGWMEWLQPSVSKDNNQMKSTIIQSDNIGVG